MNIHDTLNYSWGGPTYPSYDGFLKGDSTAKAAEQSQQVFNGTLQQAFKTTFANNQNILASLDKVFSGIIANPTGFSPTAMAALNTGNMERTSTDYSNATKAVQAREVARGGSNLPSGVDAQIKAGIATSAASEEATGQRTIALANEEQRQKNFWAAAMGEENVASGYDSTKYAGEANSAAYDVSKLGDTYNASKGPGWGAILGGVAGGALDASLGKGGALNKYLGGE